MAETASAVTAAPAERGQDVRHHVGGMLVVAGTRVALPVAALREVVPRPKELSPLPLRAPGLLGAMRLRELTVPVVDLGEHLRGPLEPNQQGEPEHAGGRREHATAGVVVLVAHAGRLVGILAQEVRGVSSIASTRLLALSAEDRPLLVSHVFQGSDGEIVSVLDPARILALPGVPTVLEPPTAGADTGADTGAGAAETPATWALLRCGGQLLALDVRFVHTTLPGARARASVVDGGACLGVTAHAGLDVPVVDPLRLLGMGAAEPGHRAAGLGGAGVVLRLTAGLVVLAVEELVGLEVVAPSACMAVPASAAARPDLLAGMADLPGYGPCLVLDGDALLTDPDLRSLAATNVAGAGAAAGGPTAATARDGERSDGPTYLTYRAGIPLATPLEQVVEILPLPDPATLLVAHGAGGLDGALLGVVSHRGASLPLLHLATLLGTGTRTERGADAGPAAAQDGCLLVVAAAGGHVAFAVDSLHEIERLTWSDPTQRTDAHDVLGASPLIQVGAAPALLRDVDLVALATTASHDAASPAPR